jgi:1,2-diacylglycerol 3-beta-glucosyltransferase
LGKGKSVVAYPPIGEEIMGKRAKLPRHWQATMLVLAIWGFVSGCHWYPPLQWLVTGLTVLLAIQAARMLLTRPRPSALWVDQTSPWPNENLPTVDIFVPAKNEQAVLATIVPNLFALDYPTDKLQVWVIDDGSTDGTPAVLANLKAQFPWLNILQRQSSGHKSGALNAVLPLSQGEIILVCDADAQLPRDFLQQTIGWFAQPQIGAVQVRKTIAQPNLNWLTHCQQMEMSGDCYLQIHRTAIQGMSELRGNGMLVRRSDLDRCDGWNEDTVTDDLDLTFRLCLRGAEIVFVTQPTVLEEGVTTGGALWRQRRRWAIGGYQRYLDYRPELLRLDFGKQLDLLLFCLLQFLLPIGLIPDLLWTIFYDHHAVLFPLQTLLSGILTIALVAGLYQLQNCRGWALIWGTIQGSIYMLHWIPIMILTTLEACVRRQPLTWSKTVHGEIL